MSNLPSDITVPGRPEVHEVPAGVYADIQPDGSKRRVSRGRLGGTG